MGKKSFCKELFIEHSLFMCTVILCEASQQHPEVTLFLRQLWR